MKNVDLVRDSRASSSSRRFFSGFLIYGSVSAMSANTVHLVLLVTSLTSIGALTALRPIRLEHILFAVLAGSLLLLSIAQLLPASFAVEQQFVALGTFATCNVFWLLTRALFRKGNNVLNASHYLLAGSIALLILFSRSIDLLVTLEWIEQSALIWLKRSLVEILQLLSSGILLLSFWEIIRSYASSSKGLRRQKLILAGSMLIAVLSTRVIAPAIPVEPETGKLIFLWVRSMAASLMLVSTFLVLWFQFKDRKALESNRAVDDLNDEDADLAEAVKHLMTEDKLFLKAELKMMDIANALGVPEHKVSRALREKNLSGNFNQFVNGFRIEFAKHLLIEEKSKDWTILVVSMESGFASLATFNRVFKSLEGCTPKQYRQRSCQPQ